MTRGERAAQGHEILDRILAWAAGDPNIRSLILVGSRARAAAPDDLADFDIQVHTATAEPYLHDLHWLAGIGTLWVCVSDEYDDGGLRVPTRLAIFDAGVKVDFAFYPAGRRSGEVEAGRPHRILLHKDGDDPARLQPVQVARPAGSTAGATQSQTVERPQLSSEERFRRVVEEFWFEAYHVARYIARGELWLAKSRDWATKQLLLTMIEWHDQLVRGRAPGPPGEGRRCFISPDTWELLDATFAPFRSGESWAAALATMDLFRRLAGEVASHAGFAYPDDIDRNVSGFILELREERRGSGPG